MRLKSRMPGHGDTSPGMDEPIGSSDLLDSLISEALETSVDLRAPRPPALGR